MSYAQYLNFGQSTNNNIKSPNDTSNPLTYCMLQTCNSKFIHGSTAANYNPRCPECQTYMKEIATGLHGYKVWNNYCEAYTQLNTDTIWANSSAINTMAFSIYNSSVINKNTVGDNLLRNALELYCVKYTGYNFQHIPFDPNVAASPYINIPNSLFNNCMAIVVLPNDIDNDPLISRVLQTPKICTDVLAYIWAAVFNVAPQVVRLNKPLSKKFKGSKLYTHLAKNHQCYQYLFSLFMEALGTPINCTRVSCPF